MKPRIGPINSWWWADSLYSGNDTPSLLNENGLVITRAELRQQVLQRVAYLNAQGIQPNDRIALAMTPGPAMAMNLIAAMTAATAAPMMATIPEDQATEDLARLKATFLIADENTEESFLNAASGLGIRIIPAAWETQYDTVPSDDMTFESNKIALLLQTSGTTAKPKVVPLSHANLYHSAHSIARTLALTAQDRSLAIMPLFHIHGIMASLLAPLIAGGSVICCQRNAPANLLDVLNNLEPTWLTAVPTLLQGLLAELERSNQPLSASRLRLVRSSSSPLPPAVLERLEAVFKVPVLEAYGMTEAAHQICSNRLPSGCQAAHVPGSVGLAAGPEVVVLSPALEVLPPGVCGEVAIRGPGVTAGYEDADRTGWVEAASGERWFLTGDEGLFDANGRLTLTGRIKEMINRGGEKVIPRRVDEALLQYPAVEQALAFAVPHPTLGEDLAAAVVLRPGAHADEQALRRHAFAVLAPHEVPSRIVLIPDLPRGSTGKLQRIHLAEKLGAWLQPADEPASGEMEELVANTFAYVLQQPTPSRNANFFQLGGDSLSGQRAVIALEQQLALELSPTLLFAYPSVRCLAQQLDQQLDQSLAEAENPSS